MEGAGFRNLSREFEQAGATILGISFDSVQTNADFARKGQFQFPLLSDAHRSAGIAYGACRSARAPAAKRITYLISSEGKIEKSWTGLNPDEHAPAALAHVRSTL